MARRPCEQRGKTWEGSDPKCAFESYGFSHDFIWTFTKGGNYARRSSTRIY